MNKHPIFTEHPSLIVIFAVSIIVMLLLDLGIFNKKSHEVTNKEAIIWSVVWISLSMIFSGLVYYYAGATKFYEFQSAYWIEKALSVDNLLSLFWFSNSLMFLVAASTRCCFVVLSALWFYALHSYFREHF